MEIRKVQKQDLQALLSLYSQLHNNEISNIEDMLLSLLNDISGEKKINIIVAVENKKVLSTCTIVAIKNHILQQRPNAFIESIVTDIDHRRKGLATACLNFAKEIAILDNCNEIMIMKDFEQEETVSFYEGAGFNSKDETAFILFLNE